MSDNTSHCYSPSDQAADEWVATIRHLNKLHPIRQATTVVHYHLDGVPCHRHRHVAILPEKIDA